MDTTHSPDLKQRQPDSPEQSWLKKIATVIIWIELILGLSAIASAVFLNPRVPVLLYAFYGVYFAIFLCLLYSTCRSAYLQNGHMNHLYWIFGVCTIATIGIIVFTFLTAPNSGEIAFISLIVFLVSLVLFPFISAILYCFLRGNLILPTYMRGKTTRQRSGVDQLDGSKTNDAANHIEV